MKKGIELYPHLKHLIYLWPGGWEDHSVKINEYVFEHNQRQHKSGRSWRPVQQTEQTDNFYKIS